MHAFTIARVSVTSAFQNWRLWLIQFAGNALLFLLFTGGLLIPVANTLYVFLNALVAILLLTATFALHGGTLNYFSEKDTSLYAPLKKMFLRALRNILPILVCAAALFFLWMFTDKFDALRYRIPFYLRSLLSASMRKHISVYAIYCAFEVVAFALRWILIPGFLLPFAAAASNNGFRGLGLGGFRRTKNAIGSLSYWLVLTLAAIVGVFAARTLLDQTPDFTTSSYPHEWFSLVIRLLISYLLALVAWMVTCSVVGRSAWKATLTVAQVPRQPNG